MIVRTFWLTALVALAGLLFALTGTGPQARQGSAENIGSSFTSAQREDISALVEQYILANPEIIPQAITQLRRREADRFMSTFRETINTPYPGAEEGNPNGDITLVEFSDFQCPYCKKGHGTIKALIAADPNIRVVYRELPILDREPSTLSQDTARAALAAANQGRYVAFRDAIFGLAGRLTQERLVETVRALDLDERQLAADSRSAEVTEAINTNMQLAGNLNINGTPAYVVEGELISGAASLETLMGVIAQARQRLASPAG